MSLEHYYEDKRYSYENNVLVIKESDNRKVVKGDVVDGDTWDVKEAKTSATIVNDSPAVGNSFIEYALTETRVSKVVDGKGEVVGELVVDGEDW